MFKVLKSEQKVVEGGLSIPEQEYHKHPPSHPHSRASLKSLPWILIKIEKAEVFYPF